MSLISVLLLSLLNLIYADDLGNEIDVVSSRVNLKTVSEVSIK